MGIAIKPTPQERIAATKKLREGKITRNAKRVLSSRSFNTEGWLGEGKREHDFLAADIPE